VGKDFGIAIAVILGIRGAIYIWAFLRYAQDRRNAWGTFSKRGDRG
jgi:hypothetical protein